MEFKFAQAWERNEILLPSHRLARTLDGPDVTTEYIDDGGYMPNGVDTIILSEDEKGPVFVCKGKDLLYSLDEIRNALFETLYVSEDLWKRFFDNLGAG